MSSVGLLLDKLSYFYLRLLLAAHDPDGSATGGIGFEMFQGPSLLVDAIGLVRIPLGDRFNVCGDIGLGRTGGLASP